MIKDFHTGVSLDELLSSKTAFTDKSFNYQVHEKQETNVQGPLRSDIIWKRVTDAFSDKKILLFGDRPVVPVDIAQGALPDCFLITAITVLASKPQLLRDMFVTKEFNPNGFYCVRFSLDGRFVHVIVDDVIPVTSNNSPLFSRHINKPEDPKDAVMIWPIILEKAYAKFCGGNYDYLHGGNASEALLDLSGCPVEDFNLERIVQSNETEAFWNNLNTWKKEGHLVACCFCNAESGFMNGATNRMGIIENHAYALLEVNVGKKSVLIHNPHNDGTKDTQDWYTVTQFTKAFNRVYVCRIIDAKINQQRFEDQWESSTAGGCSNDPVSFLKNPMYVVKGSIKDKIYVTIGQDSQKDKKLTNSAINYFQLGFTVLRVTTTSDSLTDIAMGLMTGAYEILMKTSFWNKRETSSEYQLDGDENKDHYVIVPSTYFAGQYAKFYITFSHAQEIHIERFQVEEQIEKEYKKLVVAGEWGKTTAGGSPNNFTSFAKNPKHYLVSENSQAVDALVFLRQIQAPPHVAPSPKVTTKPVTKKPALHAPPAERKSKPAPKTASPKSSSNSLSGIGIHVLSGNLDFANATGLPSSQVVAKAGYTNAPQINARITLPALTEDRLFVIIPSTFKSQDQCKYKIVIFVKKNDKINLFSNLKELKEKLPDKFDTLTKEKKSTKGASTGMFQQSKKTMGGIAGLYDSLE